MVFPVSRFQAVSGTGGLFPESLLTRLLNNRGKLPGSRPAEYGLCEDESLDETIAASWEWLQAKWQDLRQLSAGRSAEETAKLQLVQRWLAEVCRELGFGERKDWLEYPRPSPQGSRDRDAGTGDVLTEGFGIGFAAKVPSVGKRQTGRGSGCLVLTGSPPFFATGSGRELDLSFTAGPLAGQSLESAVQADLKQKPDVEWALLSNGTRLRIIRKQRPRFKPARSGQTGSQEPGLEFDLELMFDQQREDDFRLFWLLAHASRFRPRVDDAPESCWLSEWSELAGSREDLELSLRRWRETEAGEPSMMTRVSAGCLFYLELPVPMPVCWCAAFPHPKEPKLWLCVPGDSFTIVPDCDLKVARREDFAPLHFRCGYPVWIHEQDIRGAIEIGKLETDEVRQIARRVSIAVSEPLARLQDDRVYDPDYEDWIEELAESTNALAESLQFGPSEEGFLGAILKGDWTSRQSAEQFALAAEDSPKLEATEPVPELLEVRSLGALPFGELRGFLYTTGIVLAWYPSEPDTEWPPPPIRLDGSQANWQPLGDAGELATDLIPWQSGVVRFKTLGKNFTLFLPAKPGSRD